MVLGVVLVVLEVLLVVLEAALVVLVGEQTIHRVGCKRTIHRVGCNACEDAIANVPLQKWRVDQKLIEEPICNKSKYCDREDVNQGPA